MRWQQFAKLGSYACLAFILMSADQHLQTTADPNLQVIQLDLGGEVIDIHLNAPNVEYEKAEDGSLRHLFFQHTMNYYQVYFHHNDIIYAKERPALVHRFRVYDGMLLREGSCVSLDGGGKVTSESQWKRGKLHGSLTIYDRLGQVRELRHFEEDIPVGLWQTFYHDGTVATEIQFPENLKAWKETYLPGIDCCSSELYSCSYYHPITLQAVFYDLEGRKRSEQSLKAYLKATGCHVELGEELSSYDSFGNVTRQRVEKHGKSLDTLITDSHGAVEMHRRSSIGEQLFKTSYELLPKN